MQESKLWMDPVHQGEDGFWYFWDETWSSKYGPYRTEDEANAAIVEYARTELRSRDERDLNA